MASCGVPDEALGAVVLLDPAGCVAGVRAAPCFFALRFAEVAFALREGADLPVGPVPARDPRPAALVATVFFLRVLAADFALAVEEAAFFDARFTVPRFVAFLAFICLAT
jgi:hypothetical protein